MQAIKLENSRLRSLNEALTLKLEDVVNETDREKEELTHILIRLSGVMERGGKIDEMNPYKEKLRQIKNDFRENKKPHGRDVDRETPMKPTFAAVADRDDASLPQWVFRLVTKKHCLIVNVLFISLRALCQLKPAIQNVRRGYSRPKPKR